MLEKSSDKVLGRDRFILFGALRLRTDQLTENEDLGEGRLGEDIHGIDRVGQSFFRRATRSR